MTTEDRSGVQRPLRRSATLRRLAPPLIAGVAAVATGVGAVAWVAPRADLRPRAPTILERSSLAALLNSDRAVLERLQQMLAYDDRQVASLAATSVPEPRGIKSTTPLGAPSGTSTLPPLATLPPLSLPSIHATTGASGAG